MDRVESRIWASDMRDGRLPHVCVATGEPTEDSMKYKFATAPPVILLFILIGLLPYVIAFAVTAKRASGRLPMVRARHWRVRLNRWGGLTAILLSFVLLIAGGAVAGGTQDSAAQTVGGILIASWFLLVMAGIIAVIARGFIGVKGKVEGVPGVPDNWVTLSRVHPAFADAVIRMYTERANHAAMQGGPQAPYQPLAPTLSAPVSTAPLPPPTQAPLLPPYRDPYSQPPPGS